MPDWYLLAVGRRTWFGALLLLVALLPGCGFVRTGSGTTSTSGGSPAANTSPSITSPTGSTSGTGTQGGSTSTTSPHDPQPDGPSGRWNLIFQDDFQGTQLDRSHWSTCYFFGCTNNGNPELQWYAASQVKVANGAVSLTAIPDKTHGKSYLSGMLSSYGKFSFLYGYAQVVAKLPTSKGMWSAFWTLSTNGKWPPEIDIMENWAQPQVSIFVHPLYGPQQGTTSDVPTFASAFHTYGIEWTPDSISWYVDGHFVQTFYISINEPQYLLATLAVSGSAKLRPSAGEQFPQSLVIKSIQVWQQAT